jgi:hypothetical protein
MKPKKFKYAVETKHCFHTLMTDDPYWFEKPICCCECHKKIADTPKYNVYYYHRRPQPLCFECAKYYISLWSDFDNIEEAWNITKAEEYDDSSSKEI